MKEHICGGSGWWEKGKFSDWPWPFSYLGQGEKYIYNYLSKSIDFLMVLEA